MDQILSTLGALPKIAANPLAIVGYLLVVAAWTMAYFRTARFKILMGKIAELPEKDRKSTIGIETNTIIPDNITAEQWLRSKRDTYYVYGYIITIIVIAIMFLFAYMSRGSLNIDSVNTKNSKLFITEAIAQEEQIQNFTPNTKNTKNHTYSFDVVLRNSSDSPVTVTEIRIIFDPDLKGSLSSILEVSNTYIVTLNPDGTGKTDSSAGQFAAYAWYPSPNGKNLIVKTPLQQSLKPLETDRFIIKVIFPDKQEFRGPMKNARLELLWNGSKHLNKSVSLE